MPKVDVKHLAKNDPEVKAMDEMVETKRKELSAQYLGRRPKKVQKEMDKLQEEARALRLKKTMEIQNQRKEAFLHEYMENGGNSLRAVNTIFGPTNPKTATEIANGYLKDSRKTIARALIEKKGYSYGVFLEHIIQKMQVSRDTDWFDRLFKLAGYDDFITAKGVNVNSNVNILGSHKNLQKEFGFVEGEVVETKELEDGE